MLFQLRKGDVVRIEPDDRRIREEEIHSLIERNLKEFLGLTFVCHKPHIGGKEIDTLAFDPAMRVPVVVEYKREKDRHVIDQVVGYCAKAKDDKLAVMRMLQKGGITEDAAPIDLDSPQVVIVAKNFTPEQQKGPAIVGRFLRLFRYQLYAGGIVSLEEVSVEEGAHISATPSRLKNETRGGPYDLDHFGMKPETRELYDQLDKGIAELDSRVKRAKVNKEFIGYGATGYYFCTVNPAAKALNVHVKCRRGPAQATGLELKKLPRDRYGAMTHTFKISEKGQVKPALRIISGALRDSI